MTSATRLLRPYKGLDTFQHALDRTRLAIGGSVADKERARVRVSASSFLHDPTVVTFASTQDEADRLRDEVVAAAQALEMSPADIDLLVVASTTYLRAADIVHQATLADPECIPRRIAISGDDQGVRALRTPNGGCDLDIAFVLGRDLEFRPLRPRRKGTWLGRTRFEIRTDAGHLGFTPRFLTDAEREQFSLPPGTIRFVDVNTDALFESDLREAVELYVDKQLLTQLNLSPDTPGARSFQRQLFLDAIGAIVRAARLTAIDDVQLADLQDTVLERVIDAAAGRREHGESDDQFLQRREFALMLLKDQPETFIGRVEASLAPRDDLQETIAGSDE